ncbi:MAG: glycosyltransferase family 4 protein [Desulfobaccales bacterium]
MHVGLLIYGSLDTISGGFIYDRRLVSYLRRQGDRVEVIALPWRSYGLSLLDNLDRGLRRRLDQAPFDLLLQDELVHPSCFRLNGREPRPYPLIAVVHHLRCREHRPAWQNRLYRLVEKRYLTSLDGFICVSRTTQKDVQALMGRERPLVVASPGRDGLPGAVTRDRIRIRALAPEPLQIIFVGNLIPRKELHTLIAALTSLPRNDWRLTVAGSPDPDPAYARAIRRQIQGAGLNSRVTLLGALPPGELAARCEASHLLAVPSSYEGFGIVYLEGMHFGLPAIAGTDGAARELVHHGENGYLVPPGDAVTLARYLKGLLEDREILLRLALSAHHTAAAHPTWDDSAARSRAFLQTFLA